MLQDMVGRATLGRDMDTDMNRKAHDTFQALIKCGDNLRQEKARRAALEQELADCRARKDLLEERSSKLERALEEAREWLSPIAAPVPSEPGLRTSAGKALAIIDEALAAASAREEPCPQVTTVNPTPRLVNTAPSRGVTLTEAQAEQVRQLLEALRHVPSMVERSQYDDGFALLRGEEPS